MQQHPVPQAITTYKFRLVGDMTLKQFLELAFGGGIAWLIFSSNLNFLFKWTLGPVFGFLGFALAFVPIEDRPLDQWIINFIKAVFLPTQYLYKTEPKTLDIFKISPPPPPPSANRPAANQAELTEYLTSLPASPATVFEQAEQKYLDHIHQLFGALGINQPQSIDIDHPQPANPYKSNLKGVRVRKLFSPQMCLMPRATIFQTPAEPTQASMPVKPPVITKPTPQVIKPTPVKAAVPKKSVPKLQPKPQAETVAPTFSTGMILPNAPDKPNLIAGITLDKAGKIIPGVIIEIQDKQSQPVRALKSNKLGQFFIATPLSDGVYQIHAEHPDQKFAIIKLEAKGEIIPPLKIQAL
ncbi:MAG: hypothetical protein V1810_00900 [Candidatus Beckwithbacteria bacterium]